LSITILADAAIGIGLPRKSAGGIASVASGARFAIAVQASARGASGIVLYGEIRVYTADKLIATTRRRIIILGQ
jgi:hypothetical protein